MSRLRRNIMIYPICSCCLALRKPFQMLLLTPLCDHSHIFIAFAAAPIPGFLCHYPTSFSLLLTFPCSPTSSLSFHPQCTFVKAVGLSKKKSRDVSKDSCLMIPRTFQEIGIVR